LVKPTLIVGIETLQPVRISPLTASTARFTPLPS
jgi:hypothetical protein